jgi:hypothetical protein
MQDCLSSPHSHAHELSPDDSFSFWRASLHDWLQSASLPCKLKVKVTLSHSHVCKSTNWWIMSPNPTRSPSTASTYLSNLTSWRPPKCISKLAWLRLQSAVLTGKITISECISMFTWSHPRRASSHMFDYVSKAHLETWANTASECISGPNWTSLLRAPRNAVKLRLLPVHIYCV